MFPIPPFCPLILPRAFRRPPSSPFFPQPRPVVVGVPLGEVVHPSSRAVISAVPSARMPRGVLHLGVPLGSLTVSCLLRWVPRDPG